MAQTGALQLRCCANKNSVTHNSFSLQIVKRSLFYSRKSSLATGTTRSTVSLGDFEPCKGTRERVKIKSFIIIRVRRQRSKKKAVTNGIIRDTLRSAVFEFSVLAAGYNGINHYRGEQVQPLNRDRWKPVTGAVAFLFFLSSPSEESHRSSPPLRMRCAASHVCVVKSFGKQDRYNDLREIITRISLS